MAERYVKSQENIYQHNSEVGGAHALFALTRADLFTFRNEWAELRLASQTLSHLPLFFVISISFYFYALYYRYNTYINLFTDYSIILWVPLHLRSSNNIFSKLP